MFRGQRRPPSPYARPMHEDIETGPFLESHAHRHQQRQASFSEMMKRDADAERLARWKERNQINKLVSKPDPFHWYKDHNKNNPGEQKPSKTKPADMPAEIVPTVLESHQQIRKPPSALIVKKDLERLKNWKEGREGVSLTSNHDPNQRSSSSTCTSLSVSRPDNIKTVLVPESHHQQGKPSSVKIASNISEQQAASEVVSSVGSSDKPEQFLKPENLQTVPVTATRQKKEKRNKGPSQKRRSAQRLKKYQANLEIQIRRFELQFS